MAFTTLVSYYDRQTQGKTIHSPRNCLPGAGWLPVTTSRLTLSVDGEERLSAALLLLAGLLYFTQVSVDGSYAADLLPGFLIIGLGIPFSFVPITIAAVADSASHTRTSDQSLRVAISKIA